MRCRPPGRPPRRAPGPRGRRGVRAHLAAGKVGGARAIRRLRPLLETKEKNLWWSAGEAFRDMGPASVGEILAMLGHRNPGVRKVAASMLHEIDVPADAGPVLRQALKDPSWFVRYMAIMELRRIKETEAVEDLIRLAGDDNVGVRGLVAEALGAIGDARAIPVLKKLLDDKNPFVRKDAAAALRLLNPGGDSDP